MQVNSPDFEGMRHYAWALLNDACDSETQAKFNALALVPIEGRSFVPLRSDRSISNK